MAPDGVLMVIALKPATIVIAAALVVALLANVVLSIIIKRRETRRTKPAAPVLAARVQPQRIQRATANSLPEDLQERLRYLTGGDKALDQDEDDRDPSTPPVPDHTAPVSGPRAPVAERFDITGFLGDDMAPVAGDDRTSFFGAEDVEDATHALTGQGGEQGSTHFFGTAPAGDATSRFGDEPQSLRAPVQAQEDSTRFFGAEDDDAAEAPSGTDFFTAGDFADISIDDDLGDGTGRLQALPAASFETAKAQAAAPAASDAFDDAAGFQTFDDEEQPAFTAPVPAPPAPVVKKSVTGALDAVRACVATFSQSQVIAVSVLDGSGRVLAGESDADLTGELRSLMAESGLGNAASVDQAVQLQDNTVGALLLFPTGANALLGALVRDEGAGDETRASLQGLAHEIGDAMQRAS